MKKTIGLNMFVLAATLIISACGGGGGGGAPAGGGPPPVLPTGATQITSLPLPAIMAFRQSVPSLDYTDPSSNEIFPGQANMWTLEQDFALVDGFDGQFVYALWPTIISGGSWTSFPPNQVYSELTYYTPTMGTADGVKVAAVSDGATVLSSLPSSTAVRTVITGTCAAFLNATSDSRLQQVLDLTSLPTGTPSYLRWHDAVYLDTDIFVGINPTYSVVLRPLNGNPYSAATRTFYGPVSTTSPLPFFNHSFDIQAYAGQKVVLSFEVHSSTFLLGQSYAIVDTVSIQDYLSNPRSGFLTNGGFETCDLTGWTTNTPAEVQNVTSGPRANLEGLTVTRSFYTVPNKLWGRWVDVYSNPTGTAITRTVTYETQLGSTDSILGNFGIIYDPETYSTTTVTVPRALTSWDASSATFGDGTRDIGLVFGHADIVEFTSSDGVGAGSDVIDVSYVITVPAGGKVALVNFVLMDGTDTGSTAGSFDPFTDATARATEIDTEAMNILNNFWTDPQYLRGMTDAQMAIIKNFPN